MSTITETLQRATDALTVRRVFGEPYEKDGLTLVPAAALAGGGGAGTGRDPKGQEGEGGGFGVAGRPAGAYVIRDGDVRWQPAVDPHRMIAVVGFVACVLLVTRARVARARIAAAGIAGAPGVDAPSEG